MSRKTRQIIYWIATGLLCLLMLLSAQMYIFNYDLAARFYTDLGFPTYLIYPSAILKILGVIAIVSRVSLTLKEWAYVGFFFDLVLATTAHYMAGDGLIGMSLFGLLFWGISYFLDKQNRPMRETP